MPWVTRLNHGSGIRAIAGPDQVVLHSDVKLHGKGDDDRGRRSSPKPGERTRFVLTHAASHLDLPVPPDADQALDETDAGLDVHGPTAARITGPTGPRCSGRC